MCGLVTYCKNSDEVGKQNVIGVSFSPTQDVSLLIAKVVTTMVSLMRQVLKIILRVV